MPPELVMHKPARECPISEPHPAHICGIVKARQQAQATADTGKAPNPDA
jgi:hypothetical protein